DALPIFCYFNHIRKKFCKKCFQKFNLFIWKLYEASFLIILKRYNVLPMMLFKRWKLLFICIIKALYKPSIVHVQSKKFHNVIKIFFSHLLCCFEYLFYFYN